MKNPFHWFQKSKQESPSRRLEIETLEPRILYSGTPVPDDVDVSAEEVEGDALMDQVAEDTALATPPSAMETAVLAPEDQSITQETVEALGQAAAERWKEAGISPEQAAALENVIYVVGDLPGNQVASTNGRVITIDADANGREWFVDSTPMDDLEYAISGPDGAWTASSGEAAGKLDLLTAIMHEQGHILGLEDIYHASEGSNLLYGGMVEGERRLPEFGQADGALAYSLQGPAHAVFTINNLNDDTIDATVDTLREAIRAANTDGEDSQIVLGAGTFTLSISGINEDSAATGDLDIRNNGTLTISGQGVGVTVIDAGLIDRVFHIVDAGTVVHFQDLTITGGFSNTSHGAGFYNNGGNITLTNVEIDGNLIQSTGSGDRHAGGFYSVGGSVTGTDVQITNNVVERNGGANNGVGGGFWISNGAVIDLTNVEISGNQALEGGGFYISGALGDSVTLTNAVIDNNNALVRGGGFRNSGVDTTVTIDGGVISNNVAQYEHGGGFYNNGQVILKEVDVTGNSVLDLDLDDGLATARQEDAYGGGFYNSASAEGVYQAGVVDITGGSISNNVAYGYGGGFWNRGGTVTITGTGLDQVEIAGNQAGAAGDANGAGARSGGGFWNTDLGTVNLTHVSFNNAAGTNPNLVTVNTAGQVTGVGAGFFNSTQGVVNLDHVDITGHSASEGGAFYQDGVQSKVIGTNVTLTDNYARTRGGGFANRSTGAYVELTDSFIDGNTVENENGGGFYNNGTVSLVNTDVTNNTLLDMDNANRNAGLGGSFYNAGGTIYLKATSLSDNVVWGSGGGFYNDGGILEGEDVVVDGNALFYVGSTAPSGGGFVNTNQAKTTLTGAVISNNSTGTDTGGNVQGVGGGFYNVSQGEVTLQGDSQIVGNKAADGAGFYNSSSGSVVTLIGAAGNLLEVQNNTARLRGAGFRSTGNTLVNLSYVSIDGNIAENERGGGFYADGAVVTGDHVYISNNQTAGNPPDQSHATSNDEQGAGFWLSSHGKVSLTDSEITNNTANADGGGFYVNTGVVTLTRTLVTDNRAENSGGGFLAESSSRVNLEDSSVSGNIARDHGGGFYARNDSEVTAVRTHIDDNLAGYEMDGVTRRTSSGIGLDLRGGGFSAVERARITLTDSTVDGNEASRHGGGINLDNEAALRMTGVTVADNVADNHGAGIRLATNALLIAANSTISGNYAGFSRADQGGAVTFVQNSRVGGGIWSQSNGTVTILNHVTVTDNRVTEGSGAGIYRSDGGSITLENSIVYGNLANVDVSAVAGDTQNQITLVGGNVVGTHVGSALAGNTAGRIVTDPNLAALALNGGFGRTHAIDADSVASGAALNTTVATDQTGAGRAGMGATTASVDFNSTGADLLTDPGFTNGVRSPVVSGTSLVFGADSTAPESDLLFTQQVLPAGEFPANYPVTVTIQYDFTKITGDHDPTFRLSDGINTISIAMSDNTPGTVSAFSTTMISGGEPAVGEPASAVFEFVLTGTGTTVNATRNGVSGSASGTTVLSPFTGLVFSVLAGNDGEQFQVDNLAITFSPALTGQEGGADLGAYEVDPAATTLTLDSMTVPEHGLSGETIAVSAGATSTGAGPVTYDWTVTDELGAVVATGSSADLTFAHSTAADDPLDVLTLTLTVTDTATGQRVTQTRTLTVMDPLSDPGTAVVSITVDTAADVVDGGDGVTSLREAIATANASPAGAFIIEIAPGINPTMSSSGNDDNNTAGDFDITKTNGAVYIYGQGLSDTVISGNGVDRVFNLRPGSTVVFHDLAITGGVTTLSDHGAGIRNDGGNLILNNVDLHGNDSTRTSDNVGGGIYSTTSGRNIGRIAIVGGFVRDNAADSHGGGIYIDNNNAGEGLVYLDGVTLSANVASNAADRTDRDGGGFYFTGTGNRLIARDVIIQDNRTIDDGGGFYFEGADHAISFDTVTFRRNVAGDSSSTSTVDNDGGGFLVSGTRSVIDLINSTVGGGGDAATGTRTDGNFAQDNGAGFHLEGFFNTLNVVDTQITGNQSLGDGAGFLNLGWTETVNISGDSSITNNFSLNSHGGGFRNDGVLNITGTSLNPIEISGNYSRPTTTGNNDGVGGGFYNTSHGYATLTDVRIEDNVAYARGGGFYNSGGGSVTIQSSDASVFQSTIVNNQTREDQDAGAQRGHGGGFYNTTAFSMVSLTDVLLGNNVAADDGGGFYQESNFSQVSLTRVDVLNNVADDEGGGFSNASNASIVLMDTVLIDGNQTTTSNGAGFRNAGVIQGTTVTVTNNKLVATGDQVGAGFYNPSGMITLVDLILENNLGGGRGGGFYTAGGGIIDISSNLIRSRISGHSVVNGSLDGGGFYVADAGTTVRLTGVDVLNNTAGDDGGGFSAVSDKTLVFLTDVLFAGNIAGLTTTGSGGAFNNAAGFSQVVMDNVRITGNATLSENGGGFRNVGQIYGKNVLVSGNITGKSDQIANNDSNRIGGGFFNTGSSALIDLSLVEITDNDSHGRGGGFYSDGASQVKLTDFIISRNTTDQGTSESQGRGGGFWNSGGADVTLNRGEISENESFGHGGGFYQQDTGSTTTATNVTIGGNYAGVDQNGSTIHDTVGGGFYALSAGAVTLNHVTITNNRVNRNNADAGAGFRVDSGGNKVTLENSIVFGNFRNADSGTPIVDDVDNRTSTAVDFLLVGNNIIGVQTGNALGGNLDGRRSEDPQLGTLQDHGGAILPSGSAARSHLPGAPAVDQAIGSTLTEDQRGSARPLGAAADLGAVEVDAPVLSDDAATVSEDGPPTSIDLTGNDTQGETGDLSVTATDGSEGSVSINPDSDGVTYDPNGQYDYLAAGETATDTFYAGLQDDQFGHTGAGTFIEKDGVVAGEAVNYANYAAAPGADLWEPKNETTDNPSGFTGSRTGDFLQALPDGGGGPGVPPNGGPFVDYKVVITTAGDYTLFLRVAGFDGGSDSFFAGIVELQDGTGGANADWYAYQAPSNGEFGWRGTGDPEDTSPSTLIPATFTLAAGTYTVRIMPREDGAALDAWALVNTSLATGPSGTEAGPAQSTLVPGLLSQVQVTVTGVNDGPVLTGGTSDLTVDEGPTASLNLTDIVSFTDADLSDTHTISIDWGDGTVQTGLSATLDVAGLANLGDPSGPTPNQFSLDGAHAYADQGIYTVTVTIDDQQGGVITHSFEVTVNNVAPTAADDAASTTEETAVIIPLADLLANDTGSEPNANDNVQISIVTAPANGTLTLEGTGLRYTPNHGFNGVDSFTYTIDDGEGSLLTYTSNVNVFPGNNPPADLTAGQVESDSAVSIAVERQQFRLGTPLTVDAANPAGVTYDNGNNPADGVLAAGTVVNSHLVHFDQAQATGNGQITTTITFDSPILGLIWGDANLNATDGLLGNSPSIYPNGSANRGILDEADGDSITISADGRTLTITLNVTDGGIDQLRVLTAPLAQETAAVAVTVNGTPDATQGGFVSSTNEDTVLTVPVTNPTWIQQGLLNPDTNIYDQDQMGQQIDIDGDLAVIGGDQTGVLEDIYIYRRDSAGNWNLEQRLSNPDGYETTDEYGFDVAVDAAAGQIVVGARIDDRGATDRGSVHVYTYDSTLGQWFLTQTLGDGLPGLDGGDSLGISIDMTNDGAGTRRMVVGASGEDTGGSNSGAAYVFEFNNTTNQWDFVQRLKASDAAADDTYGRTVAIDGGTIVIGAELEDTGGSNSGSAYIYQWDGTQWVETAVLRAPGAATTADDRFGFAVDVSGDTVVVGAHQEDEGGSNTGRVHIFVRNDNGAGVADDTWTLQQSIQASDRGGEDRFGIEVAIHQNTLIVGSYLDSATGESDRGSAYIFTRSGSTWTQVQKIGPADENDRDDSENFGRAVAITSNGAGGYRYLVGADLSDETLPDGNIAFFTGSAHVFEDTGAPGTAVSQAIFEFPLLDVDADSEIGRNVALSADGNTAVVGAPLQGISGPTTDANRYGVAYIYRRNINNAADLTDDTWTLVQTLRASNAGNDDRFGNDVGISADGSTIVVGAYQEDTGGTDTGSAYVFELQGGTYVEVAKLNHTGAASDDEFGFNVAVNEDGSVVAVGTRLNDAGGASAGAVMVYHRDAAGWASGTETYRLVSDDLAAGDEFGRGVAVSGNRLVVGSRLNDSNAADSGAVYVFTFNGYLWQQTQKLVPADLAAGDNFGLGVDISGDVIVAGAHLNNSGTDDEGAAYVFRFDPAANGGAGAFVLEQKLTASNAGIDDNFGRSVAVFGNRVIVGANLEDSSGSSSGAAYVFEYDGGAWTETQMLLNNVRAGVNAAREFSDNGDQFGISVDIAANTALVGANDFNRVIDVNGTPDNPNDDYIIRNQGTAVPFALSPNNGDGNTTFTITRVDATSSGGGVVTTDGSSISFDPNGDFDDLLPGQSEDVTFTYDIFDGVNTVTVSGVITVHGVNDAPVANPDVIVVNEDDTTATVIPVSSILGNDTDADAGDQKLLGGVDLSALTGGIATVDTIQIGETGSLSVTHERQTVTLNRTFTNPVVIAQSPTFNDGEPVIVRISNITGTSFDIQLVEPTLIDRVLDGTNNPEANEPIAPGSVFNNGTHPAETVSFIVIEAGTYVLENGSRLEAGFVETANTTASGGFVTQPFSTEFTGTPIILSQVQTLNSGMTNSGNPDGGVPSLYLKTRQQSANANSFQIALENQESFNAHPTPERIGYLAIQSGAGQWGSVSYQAGSSSSVDENFDTINFSAAAGFTTPPLVITGLGTENTSNEDTSVRIQNVTATNFQVRTQEDTSANEETDGGNETVTFLAISGSGFLNAIDPNGNITFHPNGEFEHLAAGEFSDQVITYIVRDASGAESTSTLTIRVAGQNDNPVVTGESFTTTEDDVFDSSLQDDYEDAIQADNPLLYWRLGEDAATKSGGGTAQNAGSLGAAGNATYQGAVGDVSDTHVPNTNGAHLGSSPASGTSGDAISVQMTGTMPSTTLTAEMWIRSDASNASRQMALISYAESDSANNEFLVLTTTGGIQVHINSASVTTGVPTSAIADGQWHHFAITYDDAANQGVIYVDGVGTAFTHNGGAISTTGRLILGQEQDSLGGGFADSQKFIGDIDEFALYDSVLSQPQLQAHIDNTDSANLLHNDTDVDASDVLTLTPGTITSSKGATVVLQADGNFTYDPTTSAELQALAAGETTTDTFEYTVDDGNGGLVTGTATFTVNGLNDPVSVGTLTAENVDENQFTTLTGTFTDPDGSDGHSLTVTWDDPNDAADSTFAVPATGTLTVGQTIASSTDTAVLTITSVNTTTGQVGFSLQHRYLDDGAAPGNSTGSDIGTITVTVEDALGLDASNSTTVTVSNVAPTPVTDAANVSEDGTVDLDLLAGASDASPLDAFQLNTVETVSAKGALITVGPDGRTVTYDTNGQFNHLGTGQSETDTFTYSIIDDDGGVTYRTVTITVFGDNDAPVLHNAPASDLVYEERGTPVYVAPDLVVVDLDSANLEAAVIQIAAGGRPGDSLEFAVEPPLELAFARTEDPTTGVLTIVITGSASLDVYEDVLRSLVFRNENFNPDEGIRAITIQVFDGALFSNEFVSRIGVVNLPDLDAPGTDTSAPGEFGEAGELGELGGPTFPGLSTGNGILTIDLTGIRNALRNLAGSEQDGILPPLTESQTPEELAAELRVLVETQMPYLESFLSGINVPARLVLGDTAGRVFAIAELNLDSGPGQDPFGNILIMDTTSTEVAMELLAAPVE